MRVSVARLVYLTRHFHYSVTLTLLTLLILGILKRVPRNIEKAKEAASLPLQPLSLRRA